MAARKRKKAGAAKRKTAPARKSKSGTSAKRPAKKAKGATRKSAKARPKKAVAGKPKRGTKGEGDYAASRAFLKDQAGFVEKNRARIPAMGKEAEKALDGPDGAGLRDAEASAAARSRDIF
jgi:hypothetical protein